MHIGLGESSARIRSVSCGIISAICLCGEYSVVCVIKEPAQISCPPPEIARGRLRSQLSTQDTRRNHPVGSLSMNVMRRSWRLPGLAGLSRQQQACRRFSRSVARSLPLPAATAPPATGRLAALQDLLKVSEEVRDALATNRPVVALESTIYTHGALGELNLEDIVRQHGAVPAVVGILEGVPSVGLLPEEIAHIVENSPRKVSRRDISFLVGMVCLGKLLCPEAAGKDSAC